MTEREIFEIENTRPHVVILGAGATIATIPNGDKMVILALLCMVSFTILGLIQFLPQLN